MDFDENISYIMKNQIRNGTYISAVLFFGFIGLYIYAEIADPHPNLETSPITYPHFSFGNVNVTVAKNWGGNVILFNQEVYYSGSIISITGDKTVSEVGWDGPGIYFRSIKHTVRKDWDQWTLMIRFWYPIIIFGILPAIFAANKLRAKIIRRQPMA